LVPGRHVRQLDAGVGRMGAVGSRIEATIFSCTSWKNTKSGSRGAVRDVDAAASNSVGWAEASGHRTPATITAAARGHLARRASGHQLVEAEVNG
jgi:hypothetical protein